MIIRSLAVTVAAVLAFSAAHAASDGSLAADILKCSAQQDEKAQLACYNQIATRLKAGGPLAVPSAVAAAPASPPQAAAPAPPPARAAAGANADFGKENLPPDTPAPRDQMTARVVDVTYNFFRVFTVTLDNGQVWRQVDSNEKKARFRNDKTEVVTITRGFLDSFHLAIQGAWGSYTVKRIK